MNMIKQLSVLLAVLLASGCIDYDLSRRVVQQGNLLTPQKIKKLHFGMSKDDVNTLMGTSLLTPEFNNNRWDYAYTLRNKDDIKVKHVILNFKNDRLVKISHTQDKN